MSEAAEKTTNGYVELYIRHTPVQIADTFLEPDNSYQVPIDKYLHDPDDNNIEVRNLEPRLKLVTKLPKEVLEKNERIRKASQSHNEKLQETQDNNIKELLKQNAETTKKIADQQEMLVQVISQLVALQKK